ncbi:MAG TPA: hypothetical protein VFW24_11680 [Acidimicrobiales bacterium]|nr:hypothetical protein [Acidimicrobiales bacterium]
MVAARIAGIDFDLTPSEVEERLVRVDPEPIRDHYAVVAGRRYPVKQVMGAVTGLDRADFTTHQARAVLRRLGFGVYRRSSASVTPEPAAPGPKGGAEAALLGPYMGRWVAQVPGEILFDAESPQAVLAWLRRHNLRARVWRVPATPAEAGSSLSAP